MTNQFNLTANEIAALEICLNYPDSRSCQHSDNFSNGGQYEFMQGPKINRHAAAQLIGSLEAKGMGNGDDNDGNGHIFWLSTKGVDAIFDILDARKAAA